MTLNDSKSLTTNGPKVRVPFAPLAAHLPEHLRTRILGIQKRALERAEKDGLTIRQAVRWAKRLQLDPYKLWPEIKDPLAFRFWANVDKRGPDECWPWLGLLDSNGSAVFYIGESRRQAHLIALTLATKQEWSRRHAYRTCSNPLCVNPAHIQSGNKSPEEKRQAKRASQERKGKTQPRAILDATQVMSIRHRYADGEPTDQLASEFGVSRSAILAVVRGDTWAKVGGPLVYPRRPPGPPRGRKKVVNARR